MDMSTFGWPNSVPVKRVGSKLYVEAYICETMWRHIYVKHLVLTVILMQKGAYKQLEDFLKQFGLKKVIFTWIRTPGVLFQLKHIF